MADPVDDALAPGDFLIAVFPKMAGKRRPGVVVDHVAVDGAALVIATPATATRGAQPGALQVPEPPADGMKPSRLLVPYMSALLAPRVEPLIVAGARVRLKPELLDRLEAMVAHWFVADWRRRDPALRTPFRGPSRLHCRSSQARRRDP